MLVCAWAILLPACAVLPERGPATQTHALSDPSTTLARLTHSSRPADAANAAESGFRLLPSADHAFAARHTLAQVVERSLDAQYYHVHRDTAGAAFLRDLLQAAQRGVRVRLLVDDLHNTPIVPWLAALAAQPSAEVRFFNPLAARRGEVAWRLLASGDEFARVNRRMHNKLLIADNAVAIFGGRNIGDEYFAVGDHANFIDLDVLAAGQVAQDLSQVFDRYWNSEQAWPFVALEALPPQPDAAAAEFWRQTEAMQLKVTPAALDPLGNTPLSAQLNAGHLKLIWAPATVLADPPSKVLMPVVLDEPTAAMRGQLDLIANATSEVLLVNPYFVPNDKGLQLMAAAHAKGVRGIFVTNSLGSTDVPLAHYYYARKRARMLKLGMEIYELSPTLPQRTLSLGNFGRSLARLHAKGGIVDRRWLMVGSVNLDARSALLNTEMSVNIDSPLLAQQARQLITGEQNRNLYRVTLDDDGQSTRWSWTEHDGTPRSTTQSPYFDGWLWFKLMLQSWLVDESLL